MPGPINHELTSQLSDAAHQAVGKSDFNSGLLLGQISAGAGELAEQELRRMFEAQGYPATVPTSGAPGLPPELVEGLNRHQKDLAYKFLTSGMDPRTAVLAARQVSGVETPWETFEREQPTRAWAKKLLVTGARTARDIAKEPFKDKRVTDEKEAAYQMLKEYIQSQDAVKAEQGRSQTLKMIAQDPRLLDQHPMAGMTVNLAPHTSYVPRGSTIGPGFRQETLAPQTTYRPVK